MNSSRTISNWLLLCCLMVFITAQIGAITRLTESGLSITEWKPVAGILPPLNETAWQHQFDLYKQSPEFAAKHFWMKLDDFKHIFFWEWFHRLFDRIIGLVFAIPFVYFWIRKKLPAGFSKLLLIVFAVGCTEGLVGWFMVRSGLQHRPSVSHFMLALHLSMALLVFSSMLWFALDLRRDPSVQMMRSKFVTPGWALLALIATTIIWGAFTAGLKAGLIYNTFPNMGDGLIPTDFGNPLTEAAGVQFTHRCLAITTLICTLTYAWFTRTQNRFTPYLALMSIVQVSLGISTLLSGVNIVLATLHQAGAITLLGLMVASQNHLLHTKTVV